MVELYNSRAVRFAAIALVLLLAAGLRPPVLANGELVLGMSAAFTGASRQLGSELYRGALAYFTEINASGGVDGTTIRILPLDDAYEPVRAVHNTIAFVEEHKVPLLFGYVGTPTVTRVLPLLKRYEERGPYLLFPFTGAQPHRQPPYDAFVFNLRTSYLQETAGLVNNFINVGRRNIAIFYQADAYGRSGWDGVRRALAPHGLKIVAEATYRRGTPYTADLSAQVNTLRAANPDAIISVGAYAACAAFIRDAVNAGWDVPIANVSFVGSESMLEMLATEERRTGRNYTSRLITSQVVPSYEDQAMPGVLEYRRLMDKHRPSVPEAFRDPSMTSQHYSFVSFEGFLNAKLLTEVLRRAGGRFDRASIRTAFEGLRDFDLGIEAPVAYGSGRTQGLDYVYYTRVRDGAFVPLDDWSAWKK
jgi:branched-chain amino acid transport system substrate-binding protein